MSLSLLRGVRKSVTGGVHAVVYFLLMWALPVAVFAACCASLAGDVRQGPAVRDFLASPALFGLILAFYAFCFALERGAPFRSEWNQTGRPEANDWGLYLLAVVPAETLGRSLVFACTAWIMALRPESGLFAFWPAQWPLWLQVGLGLLIFDLVYYWYHRFSHEWNWLWACHRLHHTPERLVVSKSFRHSFPEWGLDIVLHSSVFVLTGMPAEVVFWLYAITIPIGFLSHANIAIPMATPFASIFNLPQTHRIHHDRELRGGLKNYSAFTMFWDHVFRTYESPSRYQPARLGIADYSVPENLGSLWFSFLPEKGRSRRRSQTDTRSVDALSSSSLKPNSRGSLSRST